MVSKLEKMKKEFYSQKLPRIVKDLVNAAKHKKTNYFIILNRRKEGEPYEMWLEAYNTTGADMIERANELKYDEKTRLKYFKWLVKTLGLRAKIAYLNK